MKSGDKLLLSTIRLLLSEIKYVEIAKKRELDDPEIMEIIGREIKRRVEAGEMYEQGDRPELAEKEGKEAEILRGYLPPQLSEDEIAAIIEDAVNETGAASLKDMGRVMAIVMPKVAGRAEGSMVNVVVKARLGA